VVIHDARFTGRAQNGGMRVVVAGSHGLIGAALVAHLREDGHEVARLVRRAPSRPDEVAR